MKKPDFSGYATRNDIKCSDGRTIRKDAFKHNDGKKVPIVWQHFHDDPSNVLGHAVLENRDDGVYAYCYLNDSTSGKQAKLLVSHGDIDCLSIYANNLVERDKNVLHGTIREVSLVLSGANPGAKIDHLTIAHGDGTESESEEEAIIFSDSAISIEEIKHEEKTEKEETAKEVLDSLTDKQKAVVYALIGEMMESLENDEDDVEHSGIGEEEVKKNLFEKENNKAEELTLSHSDFEAIMSNAQQIGSFRKAFLAHIGETYGIENVDYLFPDAQTITNEPDLVKRDMEWVGNVISGTHHTPFSRIKCVHADITADEARARGYVKGALKKEEVIKLLRRITTPTTIYKKQKLDRDDIVDITDLNVVVWLKKEMRMMLDEELARAVLVSDGRLPDDPDKINEENIRSIYKDDHFYSHKVLLDADITPEELIDEIVLQRENYKGTGNPALYTTTTMLTRMLLVKDTTGRRIYKTQAELESALRVSKIVEVPVMDGLVREVTEPAPAILELVAILVNLKDYTIGADKGGEVNMFDDFDIDYNQYKYLIETRCSGCLTKPKSALVFEKPIGPVG